MAKFGESSQTTTTSIPGRSGQSNDILALLAQLAQRFGGQMGDISGLAQGQIGGPTGQDMQLIQQGIGSIADMANRQATRSSQLGQARLGDQMGGMQGSSGESVQRAIMETQLQDQINNRLDQASAQGSQAAMQLPFQRAQMQMSANQQLFQQLAGASNPILQHNLQERMAQPTTTTTQQQGMSLQDMIKIGAAIGGAPFTGGASLAMLGSVGGGGGGGNFGFGQQQQQAPTAAGYGAMIPPGISNLTQLLI